MNMIMNMAMDTNMDIEMEMNININIYWCERKFFVKKYCKNTPFVS
jgi:hypothetical protein